ncbi:cupin domain-containing protein [Paenibacillus planticolens]|uniref:Cupin domain-containing protein n=1 Tax=Paenibacillus planticolens TaxID=2654976 RepID=A0ABX1ZKN7_9BACL|nr:cupin domain-containing protein [Paenibacillus planticolens]NOV00657.1 cupin domain-containing protein [Paenibacillus planticolens]
MISQTQMTSPYIQLLDLKPHPEGGWYKEIWKANVQIPQESLGTSYSGPRHAATSIYFLLHPGEHSRWHTVLSEELWLWHAGSPLRLTLGGTGENPKAEQDIILGPDVTNMQQPQVLIPAKAWQCAQPLGDEPVLVSCIVAPGFHFDDFQMI